MNAVTESVRPVAIVGAGVSGLIGYVTLRYSGLETSEIDVFDDNPEFLYAWSTNTGSIKQQLMRSESEGHFFATDFPGFALLESIRKVSLTPLLRSVTNRYNPPVDAIVQHGRGLYSHYRLRESLRSTRIVRVAREHEPVPHFVLYDANHQIQGRARHVLLALGHGPPQWPAVCADPATRAALSGRLFHAYESKEYGNRTVLVIGSGMSAATEWVNVLRAGGRVIAVRRAPEFTKQALSTPRCSFGGPWLDRYHTMDPAARAETLATLSRGSYPGAGVLASTVRAAERDHRFRTLRGTVTAMQPVDDGGVSVSFVGVGDNSIETLSVDLVIAATGFESGWKAHAVLRKLTAEYELQTWDEHLVLEDDCSVPGVSLPESVLVVAGPAARWAYPASDSFAGMKYAARRFSGRVVESPRLGPRRLAAWWSMIRGGWPYGDRHDEQRKGATPCATR